MGVDGSASLNFREISSSVLLALSIIYVSFCFVSCQEARKNRDVPEVVLVFSPFQGAAHAKRYTKVSNTPKIIQS